MVVLRTMMVNFVNADSTKGSNSQAIAQTTGMWSKYTQ